MSVLVLILVPILLLPALLPLAAVVLFAGYSLDPGAGRPRN